MASTPEPCTDGRYRDRPARDLKEWKEWQQKVFTTKYDFSKPVTPQKSPKSRKKSVHIFTQHYRWNCQTQESPSIQDTAVAAKSTERLRTKSKNNSQSDQNRSENSDFQVFIKTPISTTENLRVKQSTSVIEIKTVIGDKLGIATDKLELYIGPMKMCNLLTLGDHGVKNQSNLEMKILPGLLGGADNLPDPPVNPAENVEPYLTIPLSKSPSDFLNKPGLGCRDDKLDNEEIANYVRVLMAVQMVFLGSVLCVEKVVKQWQKVVKKLIDNCTTPNVCCELKGKKPSKPTKQKKGFCDNCILLSKLVVNAVNRYAPGKREIFWGKPFNFHKDPLEIAKAFVFKAPEERLDQIGSFGYCDAGSLMLIMMNFGPFLVDQEASERLQQEILDKAAELKKLNPEPKREEKVRAIAEIINKKIPKLTEEHKKKAVEEIIDKHHELQGELKGENIAEIFKKFDKEIMNEHKATAIAQLITESIRELEAEKRSEAIVDIIKQLNPNPKDEVEIEQITQFTTNIHEVFSKVRCDMQHYPLILKMKLDTAKLKEHLEHIKSYVNVLEKLKHFKAEEARYLREELDKFTTRDVSNKTIEAARLILQTAHVNIIMGNLIINNNGLPNANNGGELRQGADAMSSDSGFGMLKTQLVMHISKDDAISMKSLLDSDARSMDIFEGRINDIQDTHRFLKILEEAKLFDRHNLIYLPLILTKFHLVKYNNQPCDRPDEICKICKALGCIEEFRAEIAEEKPLYMTKLERVQGSKYKFAGIKIDGDVNHFYNHDVVKFRKKLAKMLRISEEKVKFAVVNGGSIVLVFLLPAEAARDLITAAKDNCSWLTEMKVFGVHVEGDEYIYVHDKKTDDTLTVVAEAESLQDNFFKCHTALHIILSQVIPCLQNVIDTWHQQTTVTIQPCSNLTGCRPYRKPSIRKSCQGCIDWATAIEDQVYPFFASPDLQWTNADSTLFSKDPLEVIKLFVVGLPAGRRYSKLGDLDASLLLRIMGKFRAFNHGDQAVIHNILKVAQIRSSLIHLKHNSNLSLDDQTLSNHWINFINLVKRVADLGHSYFTQNTAEAVIDKLTKLNEQPISERVQQEALMPMGEDILPTTSEDKEPAKLLASLNHKMKTHGELNSWKSTE
ncbi:uncharacterized protein [Amphiura filiformis]|uniref:uncharacterized protein isoform X2 n=1 Tax=Amphiura filiformis TaxID=82378 RepID=UPI003B20EF7D